MTDKSGIDFMAVGAHPDDVELGAGGTLLKLSRAGRRGVLVDMTDGGSGTRGSPGIRAREAAAAARLLGVERVCLGLPDAHVEAEVGARCRLVEVIREFRPRIIITHFDDEEHPDHTHTARLAKDCLYLSGLARLDCRGRPFRPERLFQFMGMRHFEPSFCVDISGFWREKLRLIGSYKSQFFGKASSGHGRNTDLSRPGFLEHLEVRHRYWGARIRRKYAEPFLCAETAEVEDITRLGGERFP